ncbi:MAG TPA: formate/nitrite transporter family protein [Edaphocola sp.]|nr:formate/nitrite transporter family protein [Edaphocola sp.]
MVGFQLSDIHSGALLGIATVLAYTVATQSHLNFIGALVFPVGFAIIILLGFELATSNFAIVPMALLDRQIKLNDLFRNWLWVFVGNLIGSLFFASMFYIYSTKMGQNFDSEIIQKIISVGEEKTIAYKNMGTLGLLILFIKAFLCNWMVTLGGVMGTSSTSTLGRIVALWLPVFTFFTLGLEHSIVNMFVIPAAILLKANITIADWWMWNQIPATLGNILGGFLMTGLSLFLAFRVKRKN